MHVRSFWNYSEQLEKFITKYKTRPPDIKFWPYGPYWPKRFSCDVILHTPRFISKSVEFSEPLLLHDGKYAGCIYYFGAPCCNTE